MHFLNLLNFNTEQFQQIFSLADQQDRTDKPLAGKTAVLFFPESSIRTRITFEKAVHELGGQAILFPPESLDKPEALEDVIGYIQQWASVVIVRHSDLEVINKLASQSEIPVINAMTSQNHPCEIITDLYALKKRGVDLNSMCCTFTGPNGNILKSWVNASAVFGFQLNHAAPASERVDTDQPTYLFTETLDDILFETDVLLTDSLPERLKNEDYYRQYQITAERINCLPKGALLNPCPPFFRGQEVSKEAIASEHFVGYEFKKDLLTVQKAIVQYCMIQSQG